MLQADLRNENEELKKKIQLQARQIGELQKKLAEHDTSKPKKADLGETKKTFDKPAHHG